MSLQSEDKRGQAEHLGRLRGSEGLKQDGCLNSSLGVPVPVRIRKAMRADTDRLAQNNRKETNREWQEKWETNKKTKQRNRNNEGYRSQLESCRRELSQPAESSRGWREEKGLSVHEITTRC